MRPRGTTRAFVVALMLGAVGCTVRTAYGPTTYDATRCQWTWVSDGFGGYQQLSCWDHPYAAYRPYYVDGAYVRVYPQWYVGPRARVAPAPRAFAAPPPMPHARPPMHHAPHAPPPPPVYGIPVR